MHSTAKERPIRVWMGRLKAIAQIAFSNMAVLWKNIWNSMTDEVVMSNIAWEPCRAELKTLRRDRPARDARSTY